MSYRTRGDGHRPLVHVVFGGHVVALERDTGERVWEASVLGPNARIVAESGRVFVLGNSLTCFDAATGKRLWGSDDFPPGNTLLVHGDQVFVGGAGALSCFSAEEGTLIWRDGFDGMGRGNVSIAVEGAASQVDVMS